MGGAAAAAAGLLAPAAGRGGRGAAEWKLKGVPLRIWPLNPTANGRNFDADLAKTVPAAGTAKQGFSVVRRKTAAYRAIKRYN